MASYFSTQHSSQISRTSLHNSLDVFICQLLATPGLFEYFGKIGCLQKINIFLMKEQLCLDEALRF